MFKTKVNFNSDKSIIIHDTKSMSSDYWTNLCLVLWMGGMKPKGYGHLVETALFLNHVHKIKVKEWWEFASKETSKAKIESYKKNVRYCQDFLRWPREPVS